MNTIIRWCLGNRTIVILFLLIVMGAGGIATVGLDQELLPDISFPGVFILTADPGASPQVVDREISQTMSSALSGMPGETHVTTISSSGFSTVQVQFGLDTSVKEDLDQVNQRLSRLNLPTTASKPIVQTFSFSALPSLTYSIAATDKDLVRLTKEAKEVIAPAILSAPGVGQVNVVGGEQQAITITLDPLRLAARGISGAQVQQALGAAQVDLPAGQSLEGSKLLPVEVTGEIKTADQLRALVVGVSPASAGKSPVPVTIADIATVRELSAPVNGISRTDGNPSLAIQVTKSSGVSAVTMSKDVRAKMAGLRISPADRVSILNDAADGIKSSLNGLIQAGLLGALLAILVIFLFLRSVRATLVTAVSLPASVLVALLGTGLTGYSLNVLTLAGLTIAIGRIVDDAIVVLENSYRHLQEGEDPMTAAFHGASEVATPVLSTTLTTVAVFLPIGLVGGIISKFFLPFSVTVTIALLASLLVAVTVVPVLVSFFLQRLVATRGEGRLVGGYRPLLGWSLARGRNKAIVLVTAVVILGLSLATLTRVPVNFFSFGGSTVLSGSVTLDPGTTADETSARLADFETFAQQDPQVKLINVTVASSNFQGLTLASVTNSASISIQLKDGNQAKAALARLKVKLDDLYGADRSQLGFVSNGPPTSNFSVTLAGRNEAALRDASQAIVSALRSNTDLTNPKSDLSIATPELLVQVDSARASARGLAPQTIAFAVAQALSPRPLGTLGVGGPVVTIRVDPAATTADRLGLLPLGPGTTLADVATISKSQAPSSITRQDGFRQVVVSAEFLTQDTNGASSRATAALNKVTLPAGVQLSTGGASQSISDSFGSMFKAIGVAVAIVFLILVIFFRSVVTPFVILLTMPLALIGSSLGLFITQQPLGLPALLGLLMVFGIVVSNAILLVDFTEKSGARTIREALMLAGSARLRPIIMTAIATVVALLPVASGVGGEGGLIGQSLAVVVEGGLISSTALTLLVIPVVYTLLKRRREVAVVSSPVEAAD